MDLSRYARHIRQLSQGGLDEVVDRALASMAPRLRGYARKAAPKRTGLLASSLTAEMAGGDLTLTTAAQAGPNGPHRTHDTREYASIVEDRTHFARASMEWAAKTAGPMIGRAARKAVAIAETG